MIVKTYSLIFIPIYQQNEKQASQQDILLISIGLGFATLILASLFIFIVRRNRNLVSEELECSDVSDQNSEFDFTLCGEIIFQTSPILKFKMSGIDVNNYWVEKENEEEFDV
jgi:hypothetical protein